MLISFKSAGLFVASLLVVSVTSFALGQISLPGLGQKNAGSNDQKTNKLLHENLPLVLDANSAYPTVANEDLLGGPFRGRVLPITLATLTKPLPAGDYVLPMTFFCSEYSIHRPGAGTAYVLAPAKGTAAKAISTLLWRGMLTGHKPQELQSVSWAIQGSVSYDKMPANYKRLVDELIPDMKNQVNGQAFADIEDGFQGKVNRTTRKISDAISKGTGGHVRADIKVDVELNESFQRLGRIGKMALDGENINSIVTAAYPSDEARERALYAGQGTQEPPLPAANGPWSVIVPGTAYMRFVVHGGNLQSDNVMQIRILKPGSSRAAALDSRPHFVLAQYPQSTPPAPSIVGLVNGTVNQAALSQCFATNTPQNMCVAGATDVGGLAAFSVGTGAQSPLLTAASPITPSTTPSNKICVKKLVYQPTYFPSTDGTHDGVGACIYLGAIKETASECSDASSAQIPDGDTGLNWVQTYITSSDRTEVPDNPKDSQYWQKYCKAGVPHKDPCLQSSDPDYRGSPLYRPGTDNDLFHSPSAQFEKWVQDYKTKQYGTISLLFRDVPSRPLNSITAGFDWSTSQDPDAQSALDNYLRLVSLPTEDQLVAYKPLIDIQYGFHVNRTVGVVTLDPLIIGGKTVDPGGTENLSVLKAMAKNGELPGACTVIRPHKDPTDPTRQRDFKSPGSMLDNPPASDASFVYRRY